MRSTDRGCSGHFSLFHFITNKFYVYSHFCEAEGKAGRPATAQTQRVAQIPDHIFLTLPSSGIAHLQHADNGPVSSLVSHQNFCFGLKEIKRLVKLIKKLKRNAGRGNSKKQKHLVWFIKMPQFGFSLHESHSTESCLLFF